MALINHAKREINAKIVYYGRERVGKRTALQYLYERIKPALRGELKTVPASGDSLLFFDFSPFEHPVFGGYRVRFHMYSLTGPVSNPAAWKMTLKGADGVVIVADAGAESVPGTQESVTALRGFLAAYGVGLDDIPCVLQLNGPGGPETAAALDLPAMQVCTSVAGSGEGVLQALSLLSRDVLARIGQDPALKPGSGAVQAAEAPASVSENTIVAGQEESALARASEPEPTVAADAIRSVDGMIAVGLEQEGGAAVGGTVRIPVEITLDGVVRKLVVSLSIEEG